LSPASEFLRKVRLAALDLIGTDACCLLAVSGGPDSVAMVVALAELGSELRLRLGVGHLDHAIRESSAADAAWVGEFASRLGLPCHSERVDVPARAESGRLGLEEAARQERYAFLERAALAHGATAVATAHTADDQAETILFRIVRGTGLPGMAGMPRTRPISPRAERLRLVRPLLDCTRSEVLAFLAGRGLDYLTDESNQDVDAQSRARIRHRLLPLLERDHNPEVRSALLRLAERAIEVNEMVGSAARSAAGRYLAPLEPGAEEIALPLEALEAPQLVRIELLRMISGWLGARAGPDRARLARAARALPKAPVGKQFDLGGAVAVRDYRHVRLRPRAAVRKPSESWERAVAVPGDTRLPSGLLRARRLARAELDMNEFRLTKTAYQEVMDASLLRGGPALTCRPRRRGDRFRPLGAIGERKLKDFFIDEKVPRELRGDVPLLLLGPTIIWVVGYRLSEVARVAPGTRELIRLDFLPGSGRGSGPS
jgi:tRNA(Ile)-lysidine synthase